MGLGKFKKVLNNNSVMKVVSDGFQQITALSGKVKELEERIAKLEGEKDGE